jgi:hypothetical protein
MKSSSHKMRYASDEVEVALNSLGGVRAVSIAHGLTAALINSELGRHRALVERTSAAAVAAAPVAPLVSMLSMLAVRASRMCLTISQLSDELELGFLRSDDDPAATISQGADGVMDAAVVMADVARHMEQALRQYPAFELSPMHSVFE